ncbi:HD domain-containing protein [Candidatus Woesearchaeota archaeon]|jgi:hypothetical protein|nr:HD domain-containing protein [Candidatus Woesearchaeota archaeon]
MKRLMTTNGALDLARRLLDEHPDTILGNGYVGHLESVAKAAEGIVTTIHKKNPKIDYFLKREEVTLAAVLHDIGRVLDNDQLFHELRGAKYVEENGLELGVAESKIDVYRIAQMFRPHFLVYEQFNDLENVQARKEFEPLDSNLLVPRTWQEAIVTYSDLSVVDGERVSVEERIMDIEKRYSSDPKYMGNTSVMKSLEKGKIRLLKLAERIEKLEMGILSDAEIMQYGFL